MDRLGLVIVLGTSALVLAACGGSDQLSKNEYVAQWRQVSQQALTAGRASVPPTSAGLADGAERSAAVLRKLACGIDELKAPDRAKDPQEEFVKAVREQADELDQAAAAYRKGNKKPLETIERRGGPDPDIAEHEEHALEQLKEKGYRVATLD